MTYIIPGTAFVYQGTWYTAFNEVFASGCAVETAAVEVDEFEIAGIRVLRTSTTNSCREKRTGTRTTHNYLNLTPDTYHVI